jgi:tripartite-type tricarboxylate transporter receptor subunit TctC
MIAEAIGKTLRVPVIVENRVGGAGSVGSAEVAKAASDGYTLLFGSPLPILVATRRNLPFTEESFAAVAPVNKFGHVLAAAPSVPRPAASFIAYAKDHPGELNYATTGFGGVTHLGTELFLQAARIKAVPIHYKGNAEATAALLAGDVHFMLVSPLFALRQGHKLEVLAAMDAKRSPWFPAVPSLAEVGYRNLAVEALNGIMVPRGTPKGIIDKLNEHVGIALRSPEVSKRLTDMGTEVVISTPEEYAAHHAAEIKRWKGVVREAGLELQ